MPSPEDFDGWRRLQKQIELSQNKPCEEALENFQTIQSTYSYAELRAIHITPADYSEQNASPVIFIHGGAYIGYSARSTLSASIPLAHALNREIISLDYPLAPFSRFDSTVPAVGEALAAILGKYPDASIIGDSAGGGLALAAVNHLDATDTALPNRLVLISPWCDLTNKGDSHETQAMFDPILQYEGGLKQCAAAYASGSLEDPAASPLNATYKATFPLTLLLCATREILASDSIRLHQKLSQTGKQHMLELYDGLYHSFPTITPYTSEAAIAHARIRKFLG